MAWKLHYWRLIEPFLVLLTPVMASRLLLDGNSLVADDDRVQAQTAVAEHTFPLLQGNGYTS